MTQRTFTWCQTVRDWGASPMCTRTRSWGRQAGGSRSKGYRITAHLKRFKGAVFLNEEIVVLAAADGWGGAVIDCTVQDRTDRMCRTRSACWGTPADADPRGMTLAGNQVYLLDADARYWRWIEDLRMCRARTSRSPVLDPVSVGWNGNALLVYDDRSCLFLWCVSSQCR